MAIETWPVPHSSNIDEVSYDSDTQTMTVVFKSGGSYAVGGVTYAQAEALANDPSPGSHYHRHYRNSRRVKKL